MSRSKKVLSLGVSVILALSVVLLGCNGGSSGSARDGLTLTEGVLTVGSDCDYPPFIEMEGEQVKGFEYELLVAIGEVLGLEVVYLPPQNFDTLLAAVASQTSLDVGCSSFTINDERKQLVDFAIPYFDSNQAVVALQSSTYASAMDFNGMTVGAQSGTTGADWVRENLTDSGTTLKEFNQTSELMAALVAGDIQGAFFDEPVAAEFVATVYTNAHVVESIPTGEQYGIAVSKDNPELLEAINNAMKTIKENGVFDAIFLKYFPELIPPSLAG
jgi:polar amino acid transport system substrate-binding protein